MTIRPGDLIHLALLLTSLALAYVLPFELLLLAYIVLGPAHYFTEISWLHDRKFFMPHRALAGILALAALGGMFIAEPYWSGVLLWCCLLLSAVAALGVSRSRAIVLGLVALGATLLMAYGGAPFVLAGVLLPTFIHVSIFTLVFMTLGALKARSAAQFAIVGAYLAAVAAILVAPPSTRTVIAEFARLDDYYFGPIAPSLGSIFGVPDLQFAGRITGLLSFVYTYHYLNWFIKADIIRWSHMPRPRLILVAGLSVAATGLCFYDYGLGITVLLLVSLMHVLLEFPLDTIAIRELACMATGRRPARPSSA
ncbi:MAG TPA: hypothetical protein VHZ29_14960 [Rhizomicrobium sp.]|nr:hypothetical protein [Rhizomicrobium sp.]